MMKKLLTILGIGIALSAYACSSAAAADKAYQVTTPLENARNVLEEEELEASLAEQRVEAKFRVAFGDNQDNMIKPRASRVHDRVTFVIADTTETSLEAKTELTTENSTNFNLQNWFTIQRNDNGNIQLKPYSMVNDDGSISSSNSDTNAQIKLDTNSEHTGEGKTKRKNNFKTKLSGQVVEVLPNMHLVVEAKKAIRINGETQTVTLIGIVDPNDLNDSSEVDGERIIDLKISFTGQGEVNDAIRPGWMTKLINKFKPF